MWNLKAAETKILEGNQFTQEEVTTFGKEKKKKERKKKTSYLGKRSFTGMRD